MWYLIQNTEATALTAKHQTDFALQQLDFKQHGEHRTARYPVILSFGKQFNRHIICSKSHFLPDVLAPLWGNSIVNCEQIKLANCSSAMLQLVNSMQRKPRAQSPSIGIIMQRTLPIVWHIVRPAQHAIGYMMHSIFGGIVATYPPWKLQIKHSIFGPSVVGPSLMEIAVQLRLCPDSIINFFHPLLYEVKR